MKAHHVLLSTVTLLLPVIGLSQSDLKSRTKKFRNGDKFQVEYDRFKDETRISLGQFLVKTHKDRSVSRLVMSADVLFCGIAPKEKAPAFSLTFRVYAPEWRFLNSRTLYAILDGERQDLGSGLYHGDFTNFGRIGVTETLTFLIPVDSVKKIIDSTQADLQVGGIEISLKDEHHEAFRDLLSLSEPVSP